MNSQSQSSLKACSSPWYLLPPLLRLSSLSPRAVFLSPTEGNKLLGPLLKWGVNYGTILIIKACEDSELELAFGSISTSFFQLFL